MSPTITVKRAYELAREGWAFEDIRRRLGAERHPDVAQRLAGPQLRRDLRRLRGEALLSGRTIV